MEDKVRITKVNEITKIGLMVALLCITAYISFPIPFTPILITAQTIVINLIALTLSPKASVTTVITFFLIGIIGIPVYSGGRAGISTLVGPSGGYFLGFLVSVFVVSYIRGKEISLKKYLLLTIVVATPIIYFFGALWMSYYSGGTFMETLTASVLPFIPGDIIKAVMASLVAVRLNKIFGA